MEKSGAIRTRHYATCLWPGLTELWWRGRVSALPIAVLFAVGLNLALILCFLYPDWLPGGLAPIGFWIGVVVWGFFVTKSIRELPNLIAPRVVSEKPDVFHDAQFAFLRAEWTKAEELLLQVLAIEPRDPPALLMLSGVLRHTDRVESAQMVMGELRRLEIGDQWAVEIQAEENRIQRDADTGDSQRKNDKESSQDEPDDNEFGAADLTAA